MEKQELINIYKEDLLFIDNRIKYAKKLNNFVLEDSYQIKYLYIKRFINELEVIKP
jgi:hypothetical protein